MTELHAAAVAALRAMDRTGRLPNAELPYAEVLQAPRDYLGPFDTLPDALQQQLRRLYEDDEALRTLARGPLSDVLVRVGAWLGRSLYGCERLTGAVQEVGPEATRARVASTRRTLRRVARQSTHLPFVVRRRLHVLAARRRLQQGRRDLVTILESTNFDARPLGFDYLEGLRQIRGCEAVSKTSGLTSCQLLGIDFVKSAGRYWFLEANFNPVLADARLELYEPGQDPWLSAVINAARSRGLRRVVVYGYRPFNPAHGRSLVAHGARHGVQVEVIDDLFSSRYDGRRRAWLMENDAGEGTLAVRAKGFDVLFDRALLSKQQTRQIVERAPIDWELSGVALPRLLPPGSEVPEYRSDSRYPNIVAKIDGLDRGAGVSFYKLPRVPESLRSEVDYCEEYREPERCPDRVSRGQHEAIAGDVARAWKIRSYALLTPEGVEYLSSIKVISGRSVPSELPDGKVAHKNIYLATINEGGVYSAFTSEEDEQCQRAVQAVGGALLAWLRRKYAADDGVRIGGRDGTTR